MATGKSDGLKSSFDLAMERLAAREGPLRALSAAQKSALAEIEQKTKARIAELEILYGQKVAQAADPDKAMALKQELQDRLARERERAEADKERVRGGES
jgi:hypothetical protein